MGLEKSRTKNSILNILTNSATSIVALLVSFVNRVIFLKVLDATYLGVSGLFSNILLIFSLAELGIGAALTQMFYKPFAEKNYEQLSKVTHTTRLLLNLVGVVVICLTVIFTPLLHLFVDEMDAVPNMRLIFFMYGISGGITYFLGYYRTIITADQSAYKLVKIDLSWKIILLIGQAIALFTTRNFVIYLLVNIVFSFLQNFTVMRYVKKSVPQIDYKCKQYISKDEAKELGKNVFGLSMSRVAVVVTQGTDNIVISKFLSLVTVGYAANYTMLTQAVASLVEALFGPLLSSVGNLCVSESNEKKYDLFNKITFAAFWLYGFCSLTAMCLASTFIEIVFGREYVLSFLPVFFLCFDIFCAGMYRPATLFRTAQGLFWYGKFRPLIQAFLNLGLSLLLVSITNELWAVYAGTVLSRILITNWYEPLVVLKYGMNRKPWKYYLKLISYFAVYSLAGFVSYSIISTLSYNNILNLIFSAIICVLLVNAIFAVAFCKTKEFKYWLQFVLDFVKEKIKIVRR